MHDLTAYEIILEMIMEQGIIGVMLIVFLRFIYSSQRDNRRASAALMSMLVALLTLFIRHDAQIRGLNPTAGDDESERMAEIRKMQEALIENLGKIDQRLMEFLGDDGNAEHLGIVRRMMTGD